MVKKTGAQFIDAPVVKSKPAAIAGKLGIYVGGDEDVYEKMRPILLYMGENVIRMGGNGKGLVMKICHNALVTQIQNGVNETLTLAQKTASPSPTMPRPSPTAAVRTSIWTPSTRSWLQRTTLPHSPWPTRRRT